MFYRLLSWKNPRATGIAFATTLIFIFAARYLNLIRYIFKSSYMVLGATAAAEVVGQAAFGRGLTSQFRPRQYFTIPKASLERMTDDVEQLINFFVIESQRVVFAENVYVTVAVSSPTRQDAGDLSIVHLIRWLTILLTGFLRVPHLLLPHQVRPSLGLELDRDLRHLSRSPRLHQEQGRHRCSA
jgi:ABC-type multidrug transport system fused ATPase/permease subunit